MTMNKKRIVQITLVFFLFGPFLWMAEANVQEKLPKNVERFLVALNKAKTHHEVIMAFEQGRFTAPEKNILKKVLQRNEYAKKLQAILPKKPKTRPMSQQSLDGLNRTLAQKTMNSARTLTQQAQSRMTALPPPAISTKDRALNVTHFTPKTQNLLRDYGRNTVDAYITSVTTPAVIGRSINIYGSKFGASQGRVVVVIGRELIECPVRRWADTGINITLAPEIGEAMGHREAQGILWVKLAGSELGPTTEIRFMPAVPGIAGLSADEIHPGQELLIEGGFFLPDAGSLTMVGSGSNFSHSLNVLRWTDNSILFRLSETTTGAVEQTCTLTVTNSTGAQATARVTFKPVLEYSSLRDDRHYEYDHYGCAETSFFGTVAKFFANFGGWREEVTLFSGIQLQNQWTVVSAHLDYTGGGAGHGAEIIRHPRVGSDDPSFRFVYWADGWAWIEVDPPSVRIQGPRGTTHR